MTGIRSATCPSAPFGSGLAAGPRAGSVITVNGLTQVVTSKPDQTISLTKTVSYDATGNITARSDLGSYSHDPVHVHAVTGITGSFNALDSFLHSEGRPTLVLAVGSQHSSGDGLSGGYQA